MSSFFAFPLSYYQTAGPRSSVDEKRRKSRDRLFHAAEHGNGKMVSLLLAMGVNPDRCDVYGVTPLHIAVWHNHCKVVGKLVNASSDVNIPDRNGDTALYKAVWKGCNTCVQYLLEADADVEHKDRREFTPLMVACELNRPELVQLLLLAGADIEVQNRSGETPLCVAAGHGSVECVNELVKVGAEVNTVTKDGSTPLFRAVGRGTNESAMKIIALLIANNADLDVKGRDHSVLNGMAISPLELAVYVHNFTVADLLVQAGCNTSPLQRWILSKRMPASMIDHPEWVEHFSSVLQPRSLAEQCRIVLRKACRESGYPVESLPLPVSLCSYVALHDLELDSIHLQNENDSSCYDSSSDSN